jgi:hypothetical protein
MKAMNVKMRTVPLIGKGTQNLACFVYLVYAVNSKIFFLRDTLFLEHHHRFGCIHFPLADMCYPGGVISD